jgi:Protein of unknown function (DUF1501)
MNPFCNPAEHVCRRTFLKGALATTSGLAVANWGGLFNSQTIAAEARKQGKRCILLWMDGGVSQMDTFDMKPGWREAGPFRPIATNVTGIQVCEYLPNIARHADKLAIIRSLYTSQGDHPGGTYLMHTGYRPEPTVNHPELGAMIAKYLGKEDADLPNFIQMGASGRAGAGFLGPAYQPFMVSPSSNGLPPNTSSYLTPDAERRRSELLRFVEEDFARTQQDPGPQALRAAQVKSERLLKAKGVFDINQEWTRYRELYGNTSFGKNCLAARRLVEAGVPFVEVGHGNYDFHGDNFDGHKALLPVADRGWSGLLQDLQERGLLQDTLVVWMGECGRTPIINARAGRHHWLQGWSVVLAGGGVKGGLLYGETQADGMDVKDKKVTEGDLFATIYTALGINPHKKHYVNSRPIQATAEHSQVHKELLV